MTDKEEKMSTQNSTEVSPMEEEIPANKLKEHIDKLLQKRDPNEPMLNGFDDEFNYIEERTAHDQFFGDYKGAMLAVNKTKNRYSNVLPPEGTRVKLKEIDGEEGSDYINANFISGILPGTEHRYIATQGPLQSTFGEFWRMVWELNLSVIVMLTKEVENGRLKCDRYWPEMDCPLTCGPFKILLVDEEETQKDELTTRRMTLTNMDTGEERQITQFQYTSWPDHGLPESPDAFLDLAHRVDQTNSTHAPIVVHCSAGIGRSGTFCTVHSTIEKLRKDMQEAPTISPKFNIIKNIIRMRQQRPGMVQTKDQYMFVYLTIMEEIERLFNKKSGNAQPNNGNDEEKKSENTNNLEFIGDDDSSDDDSDDEDDKVSNNNLDG